MKRILAIFLSAVIALSFAGCGGNGTDKKAGEAATGAVSTGGNEQPVQETKEIKYTFSDFNSLGNEPAGFYNSYNAPAFDDNYIYYYDDHSFYKVDYNGQNPTEIGYQSNTAQFMNMYNGYLYYVVADANKQWNDMLKFYRLDIATGESELLFSDDLGDAGWKILSMLIYKDYLFYASTTEKYKDAVGGWSGRNYTQAMAYNLNTGETKTIYAERLAAETASFTVDEYDNIYLYVEKIVNPEDDINDTYLEITSLDDIKNGKTATEVDIGLRIGSKDILYPGGLINIDSEAFARRDYAAVNKESGDWQRDGSSVIKFNKAVENIDVVTGMPYTQRWMIDDSLIVLKGVMGDEHNEIYIAKHLDFSKIDLVHETHGNIFMTMGYGIHNDKFYFLEKDFGNDDIKYLVVIDSDGNANEYTFQID